MLVEFSVGNYLSYKKNVTFSMAAAAHVKEHESTNVLHINHEDRLLKSAVIYGANASGKTNLFKAMRFMAEFVKSSAKESQVTEKIPIRRFKLSTDTEEQPSFFEIIFLINKVRYRYGFEADRDRIHSEWLFYVPNVQEIQLFLRTKNEYEIHNHFKEGRDLEEKTRDNALFLSVVAQFNGPISKEIITWFTNFKVFSGISTMNHFWRRGEPIVSTPQFIQKDMEAKKAVLKLLRFADLGIDDISIEYKEGGTVLGKEAIVKTSHRKYDNNNSAIGDVIFNLDAEESAGTKKIFNLSAGIIDALKNRKILVIDELDSSLHPMLTKLLITLFQSPEFDAQLIVITHDTSLLHRDLLRRDQIWFAEKDKYGSSDIYSLIEYKVRNDASYDKDYIKGKYGAIPFIGDIKSLLKE